MYVALLDFLKSVVLYTWRKHVVDELQKTFLSHMGISEQEDHFLILYTQFKVQSFQILTKVSLWVPSTKHNFKHL